MRRRQRFDRLADHPRRERSLRLRAIVKQPREPGRCVVRSLLGAFLLVGALPLGSHARAQFAEPKPTLAASPRGVELSGNLSLIFELNRGQTDPQVKFLSRGRGYALFLTPGEMVLGLTKPDESHAAAVIGMDELAGKVNSFIGDDPARWRTNNLHSPKAGGN